VCLCGVCVVHAVCGVYARNMYCVMCVWCVRVVFVCHVCSGVCMCVCLECGVWLFAVCVVCVFVRCVVCVLFV
jgi:hypothetical protein